MNNLRRLDLGLAVVAALVSVGGLAGAQQQKGPRGVGPKDIEKLQALIDDYKRLEPLKVTKINENIYLAKGGRGGNDANVGFVVGKSGVIFVDSKNSPESEKDVLAEIAKITPEPVQHGHYPAQRSRIRNHRSSDWVGHHRAGKHQEGDGGFHRPRCRPSRLFPHEDNRQRRNHDH